jgi:hypothetical protein
VKDLPALAADLLVSANVVDFNRERPFARNHRQWPDFVGKARLAHGGAMTTVVFTGAGSGKPVEVPLEDIIGIERGEDEQSFVQYLSGAYYIVQESLIDAMRLVVAAADGAGSVDRD